MSITHKQVKTAVAICEAFYEFHSTAPSVPSECFTRCRTVAEFLSGRPNDELADSIFNEMQYERKK